MSKDKKTGLTHVSELLLPGFEFLKPVKLLAETKAPTVQGKHHFTRIKQIDALASVAEDPNTDMGFMARLVTLCSLPSPTFAIRGTRRG
jgi:hypothetical protein